MEYNLIPNGRPGGLLVLTGDEMRAADAHAIDTMGVPGACLMENAGRHLALACARNLDDGERCLIVCGTGNNGGDGFVAARHLQCWGFAPEVLLVGDPARFSSDTATNYTSFTRMGGVVSRFDGGDLPARGHHRLVVDAVLGTGVVGAVRENAREAIDWINDSGAFVISADLPSGVCSETGRILGVAVNADLTVSFGTVKCGHLLHPGSGYIGRVDIVDIGMPAASLRHHGPERSLLGSADMGLVFAQRDANLHKGTMGHVYVLGGSGGRSGAALMASHAALRAGAGLVTIGTTSEAFASISSGAYESMCEVVLGPKLDKNAALTLADKINDFDALVLGPGFPTSQEWGPFLHTLLGRLTIPHVVDADGLNHMSAISATWPACGARIVTPHPGEAGRLLGQSTQEVERDRLASALALAQLTQGTAVLKGSHSVVCSMEPRWGICPAGNPGMATAGMGDVLSGVIGALLARGLSSEDAARAGVYWHARAGDIARHHRTENALLARDVIACLEEVERE